MIQQTRIIIEPKDIVYSLHLYFNDFSLRNTSKAISRFVTRSHTLQLEIGYKISNLERLFHRKTEISGFIIDETYIKDRTEGFDDYFPCRKKKCEFKHVKQ